MIRTLAAAFLLPLILTAQTGKLPVKRVVLFKNGVGYFEHAGTVHGNESVNISFTSGQLNDVLKSLTVLDLNGGHISGVGYGSSAPLDRQLGDLRLHLGEKATLAEVLDSLRGARIEVKTGVTSLSGRLLSVERKTRTIAVTSQEVDYVSLISDNGELRTAELSPASTVRLLDPGLTSRLDRYLNLASEERDADIRNMVISAEGTGERHLSVSYISEVPVWKSTYRLVLSSGTETGPLLQGWAIVDNVVGEDWNNVELSLVAGAPQSFIQHLSQPYYAQRPTIGLPDSVSTTPQTYESTLIPGTAQLSGIVSDPAGAAIPGATVKAMNAAGVLLAQTNTDASGSYEFQSLPEGTFWLQVEAPGFQISEIRDLTSLAGKPVQQSVRLSVGSAAQTVSVAASAAPSANVGGSRSLGRGTALGGRQVVNGYGAGAGGGTGGGVFRMGASPFDAAALSQSLGDLFEYKLKDPITILKNRSALVPIAQASIKAEKVSVWNDRNSRPRPQRAVWITNSTGLTLDGGSVSVIEDNTFMGEGIFDPIRPGEKRLLSYATDLAVNESSKTGTESQRISRVVIAKGVMTQESEVRETKTYTFRNSDTTSRTIIVEHPVRSGYQLRGEIKPVETTADWMRFVVKAEPQQTSSLVVEEARPTQATFSLSNLNRDQVALFLSKRSIDPTIESAFREILSRKDAIDALESQKSARETDTQNIFDDQQRLRENIKALKGTPEEKPLLERYTRQLNDQETQLQTLNKQSTDLASQIDEANSKLQSMIELLAFDVKL